MPKVTIKNAPKTLKSSLKRAVAFLEKTKRGNAVYTDKNFNTCLIGSYFTPEQREWINKKGLNRKAIDTVEKKIGTKNLLAMTGMDVDQCFVLQDEFDMGNGEKLLINIKQILSGQRTSIIGVEFKL